MTGTGVKQLPDTQVNLKVKLDFTLVLQKPELSLVLLNPFFLTLDPDQLVSLIFFQRPAYQDLDCFPH